FDPATPDGAAIPPDLRTGREAGSLIHPGLPAGTQVITPAVDVARAEHIAAIATAAGVLRPPFGPTLGAAMTHPTAAGTAA
ncbi:MAG: S-methyl-5-thioribose-1-phosphate isomerase, partial [Chloroflexota bacterium]|nr:S-methyl-5-thioribose-1-phosphate isomerase [Chloroflexota bacterium]